MSEREIVAVHLVRPDDVDGFMTALRYLLYHQIAPSQVIWNDGTQAQNDIFSVQVEIIIDRRVAETVAVGSICLPREFVEMARSVALHSDRERFQQLHMMGALLMRDRRSWTDRTHPLRLQLERMAREVGREIHKMHAFVRFRPVVDGLAVDGLVVDRLTVDKLPVDRLTVDEAAVDKSVANEESERHVAWFEPAHHVVRAAAPFFVKRFAAMHWAILTPIGCAHWDRQTLTFAPPAQRDAAPAADAGEALWLAYYRSIFNPARVKVDMMRREMPVRFWKNLPEAGAISELLHSAGERTHRMQNEVDPQLRKRASERLKP